jgi:hypothetical protein
MKKWNIINLVALNPNVTLAKKEGLKRPLLQNDDLLLTTVTSKKFQDLLLTDPIKQEGQDIIAEHFDITDKWAKVKCLGQEKGTFSDAASAYFYLQLTVKYHSDKDYIWISFYEGLHRHAALLLSLTLSAFNLTKNEIKFKSLTKDYFQQQHLENFKENSKQPHEQLSNIFDGKENPKMLTEPFNLRAIILKKVEGTISINAVAEFTNKSTKYSEIISNSKRTSAENSTSSLLSKALHHDQQMSTLDKCNMTTIRPNLFHTYKVLVQVKREVHMKNMKENNGDFVIYTYCELLHTTNWDEFIKNLLNDKTKWDFLDKMTKRSKYTLSELTEEERKIKITNYPPYGILWEGMTLDVGGIKGGVRKVDLRFYDEYQMLPSIVTILHAKIKNEIP